MKLTCNPIQAGSLKSYNVKKHTVSIIKNLSIYLKMIKDQKEYGYSGLNIEQLIVLWRAYLLCL